ncbi:MAG: hypothetical protein IKS90_01245 [Clostridia bacterium]|nr:hypothetical protein [Clostridia bacterium]
MYFQDVYFFNGMAYAGKSTVVKKLAEKYDGIACTENYHSRLLGGLDKNEFPCLTYLRDLKDMHAFIRRTPDEYEAWFKGAAMESEKLELKMLEDIAGKGRKVFVDTNISVEMLKKVADAKNVVIMLTDPDTAVERFFERQDDDKRFLYNLIMEEKDPEAALENFKNCLRRVNSKAAFDSFLFSGFQVLIRDDNRSEEETLAVVEKMLDLV